ncbi:MAG: hypothetical protein ACLUQW_08720 [Collinsella sp.]
MCNVSLNGTQPSDASLRVLRALEAAGLEAWYVGGWVRDALMGYPSHDVDMCCSGLWQESKAALEAAGIAVVESGIKFGGITAISDGERIEVTTYRLDGFTPMVVIPRVWSVPPRSRTIWRAATLPSMPLPGIPSAGLSTATTARVTWSAS